MSRSGYYSDQCEGWQLIMWRGAVASAIRERRGQAFLREMLAALDEIPTKRLIAHDLENLDGVCALGAVARHRDMNVDGIDPKDRNTVANTFGIPLSLACEIMYENDKSERYWQEESPEQRYWRVHEWVSSQILGSPRQ